MVATPLLRDRVRAGHGPAMLRERLEHRRRALREAILLFRAHAVGRERLQLLARPAAAADGCTAESGVVSASAVVVRRMPGVASARSSTSCRCSLVVATMRHSKS